MTPLATLAIGLAAIIVWSQVIRLVIGEGVR
jgi:hypothetical protein